jgi:hypothetical protein
VGRNRFNTDPDTKRRVSKRTLAQLEYGLILRIEEILGRVPNNGEVTEHCECAVLSDGSYLYVWDDLPIVRVFMPADGEPVVKVYLKRDQPPVA